MRSPKELVMAGVQQALEHARKNGIAIGNTVAHPSDPLTYGLLEIKDGLAYMGLTAQESPTRKAIKKTFPADEIFDANLAMKFAKSEKGRDLSELFPNVLVVELG